MKSGSVHRRHFIGTTAATVFSMPYIKAQSKTAPDSDRRIIGHGSHRYRVVPGWGVLDAETPVENCHGIVCDREGHIILLTDHMKNHVIVYDKQGRLVHKWGTGYPGAHGLSLVQENGQEALYFTDLKRHKVFKARTSGEILGEWGWPESSGKYGKEDEYRPSWTLHLPDGGFFVLDGYGRDYIIHYDAAGKFVRSFGGNEGGIPHWGPHGGMVDARMEGHPTLLIAMSDQQSLLRLGQDGGKLGEIPMPGGNPRQIRLHDGHFFVAHLADNWPKDKNSRGFLSILDGDLKVVSNPGGGPPRYNDSGKLEPMSHAEDVFLHPHDLAIDGDDSIYIAQFASGKTYPVKLERV